MSVGNGPRRRPIVAMVHGIDTAHRSLASLFFDDVRDKSWCARNHEYAVERRGIHSQVGENGADRAVYIDRQRFFRVGKCFLDCARRLHVRAVHASFARKFEQTRSARIFGLEAMTFCQRLGDNALRLSSLATVQESIQEFPPLNDYSSR